jgi:NarL family two-component system response regulator LiaR
MLIHSPSSIRIIIADACPIIRTGLITTIELEPHMHVVATVAHHHELLSQLQTGAGDVAVMHLVETSDLPLALLHDVKSLHPQVGIVMVTPTVDHAAALLGAGVNACVVYDEPPEHLHLAIWAAAQGAAMVHPDVAIRLMTTFNRWDVVPSQRCAADNPLSEREQEILRLVARGATNRCIADRLTITIPTVKRHLSNILHKLQAVDRMAAVAQARARGFL